MGYEREKLTKEPWNLETLEQSQPGGLLAAHSDAIRHLQANRQTLDVRVCVRLPPSLCKCLVDVLVHVVRIHLFNGEFLRFVFHLVVRNIRVTREA